MNLLFPFDFKGIFLSLRKMLLTKKMKLTGYVTAGVGWAHYPFLRGQKNKHCEVHCPSGAQAECARDYQASRKISVVPGEETCDSQRQKEKQVWLGTAIRRLWFSSVQRTIEFSHSTFLKFALLFIKEQSQISHFHVSGDKSSCYFISGGSTEHPMDFIQQSLYEHQSARNALLRTWISQTLAQWLGSGLVSRTTLFGSNVNIFGNSL